jgi:hypothetical protein
MYITYSDHSKKKLSQTNSRRYLHIVANHSISAGTRENTALNEPNFKISDLYDPSSMRHT